MIGRAVPLLVLAVSLAGPAMAGARQEARAVMPTHPDALKLRTDWGYSDAIVTGDTVYVSGIVVSLLPGETDLAAAYTRGFERIGRVLAQAGVGWDDVVDITSYHTDLTTQIPAIIPVKSRFVKAPFPAWTGVEVTRLIPDRGVTEIKLVAKRPAERR